MYRSLKSILRTVERLMTNIADNVLAVEAAVDALPAVINTAVSGIVVPAPVVDFTAVLADIAALSAKVDALTAIVTPTPVA